MMVDETSTKKLTPQRNSKKPPPVGWFASLQTSRINATAAYAALALLSACGAGRATLMSEVPRAPEVFAAGSISDSREQWRLTFTPDGTTAYFATSNEFFPFTRKATIYFSTFANGKWSAPVVAPFSGQYSDMDPFISRDGKRLYFSSIRLVDGTTRVDLDIWMVERKGSSWGQPVRLGDEVNSANDELYVSESTDGTIYFASGPMAPGVGANFDIFSARRSATGFASRVRLEGVNTTPSAGDPNLQSAWEFNPEISADGRTLVFTSLRPGGMGLGDLYVAHRDGQVWSAPRNLGPAVNTAADEYHPTLSRDGRALYFVRRASPTRGDFYIVSIAVLPAFDRK